MHLPINYNKTDQLTRRFAREEYVRRQKAKCWFCKESLAKKPDMSLPIDKSLFPKNFFSYPIHLHHNHETGITIGAVHAYCNALLWQYHDE
jgi:hypothetical protein